MESVGFGACSVVFKTKRLTVLKQPLPGFESELDFERRVYECLGQHPRIARYLRQAGVALELEYYQRGCIDQARLAMKSELPCFKWTEQIAEALVFIHSKGVIHRDLRPPNVLVTDTCDVVLADFASCFMDGVKISDVSNKTRYRRPRFDQTEDQITVQDDLFAFATFTYNLVTGKVPYEEHTDDEVVELYTRGIFPDVSGIFMGSLIKHCWQGGYSNATQVLEDIRLMKLRDLSSSDQTRPYQLTHLSNLNPLTFSMRWGWKRPSSWALVALFSTVAASILYRR